MRSQKLPLDKFAIAAALQETAARLELKGGEYFKARAFKIGARAVTELTEDIGKLINENRLTLVKGIGQTLAKQISELYATGESSFLSKLRAELPAGILELANVPGLNVKKVERLQEALNELPECFRTPVILYYFEDFSYRDIAEQMDLPLGTVMSRLARAKAHLRARLVDPAAVVVADGRRRTHDGL